MKHYSDCLYTFRTITVTIVCADSNSDGIADVGTCTSWDNNIMDNCASDMDTDPGTGSKCSCSGDDSGIPVGEITICGNGIVEGDEECDPGDPVADDCCDDSCMYEVANTPCEDGSFCTSSTGNPGDSDSCDAVGTCTSIPVDCDDGVACTDDSCNEADGFLLEYQWRKDGVDLQDDARIIGSQSQQMIILDVIPEDAGKYDCVITDVFGCTNTSDAATLTVHGPCPADFDNTGAVRAPDLAILLGAWGPNPNHPADLDADGTVAAPDLALLLGAWGPCE